MRVFGRPKNKWGWLRLAGLGGLALVLLWTALAALLRASDGLDGLAWSGYAKFSTARGLELAMIPLLAALAGGWLEHQDHTEAAHQARSHAAEQAAAAQRKAALKQIHEAVLNTARSGSPVRAAIAPALDALDGAGRAELLHFLYEKGLLGGELPAADLGGLDFSKIHLHRAHLHDARLDGVTLAQAQLDGAHLGRASLRGANLHRARLRHADLRESNLAGSDLGGARLEHANLEGADLTGARLEGAFLSHASLRHCAGLEGGAEALVKTILIETTLPDGSKLTNERGKEYLRNKEIATLIDRL